MNRVLIVDDSEIMRSTIVDLFHYFYPQVQVLEACNGREGVELAQSAQPDLVMVDGDMPIMNGSAAAEQLRQGTRTRHMTIIGMASSNTTPLVREGLHRFCHQMIAKPFNFPELAERIKRIPYA